MNTYVQTRQVHWNFTYYHPVSPPIADNEELSAMGKRLMLVHGSATNPASEVIIVPKGIINCGWVIGIIPD